MTKNFADLFKQAAEKRGVDLSAEPKAEPKFEGKEVDAVVVDDGRIKDDEIQVMINEYGGDFEIQLRAGGSLRVTQNPGPSVGAVEIDYDTFKTIVKTANTMGGMVVRAMTREQADKYYKDDANGFWPSPNIYIEVDREQMFMTSPTNDPLEVVGDPSGPTGQPPVDPSLWINLAGGDILNQKPVRVDNKVIGSLSETKNGWLYAQNATIIKNLCSKDWAEAGVFIIDSSVFKENIYTHKAVVILRSMKYGEQLSFLTTAEYIQQHSGFVRQFGIPKVVIPATTNYWLILNSEGKPYEE